ncbi:hypothetical protein [Peribacillus sp. SI8-4]|uniref:hypothetical protein n=1 Tax=Peribacillus sp. SI8-4 TaxID=3048009 RepID=UPI002553091E|nr:hypothetical protein [Peribacillus sp. SI8-4]
MKLLKVLIIGLLSVILLSACSDSSNGDVKKVEEPKKEQKEFSTLEDFSKIDFENPDKEAWAKIYMPKKDFKTILKQMSGPDDDGTITYKSIELKDSKTIEMKVNNSDGGSFENSMQAAIMDAYIRELYKHSELYDDKKEPTIRTVDLSNTVIAENKKPIEFEEDGEDSEQKPKELGTFKLGEKVNVEGHIITLTNAHYTKERNEFEETQPKEVMGFDIEYQNGTKEEQVVSAGDFEVYDSKGEKMEVYALDTLTESVQAGKHVNGPAAFGVTGNAPYEIFYTDYITGSKAKWIMEVK